MVIRWDQFGAGRWTPHVPSHSSHASPDPKIASGIACLRCAFIRPAKSWDSPGAPPCVSSSAPAARHPPICPRARDSTCGNWCPSPILVQVNVLGYSDGQLDIITPSGPTRPPASRPILFSACFFPPSNHPTIQPNHHVTPNGYSRHDPDLATQGRTTPTFI